MAATQGFFPVQQPFLCLLNVICAVFLSLPVSRTVAQRQTSREQKGTRTPDPLRVMHDDFSIFISLIRQISEICYRSATNGSSKLHFDFSKTSKNLCNFAFIFLILSGIEQMVLGIFQRNDINIWSFFCYIFSMN